MKVGGYLQICVFLPGGYEVTAYLSKCVTACSVISDSLKAPWTTACQVSMSMQFPRQEYWSGLPCPPPGDLPGPGIKPMSPASPALQANFLSTELPGKPRYLYHFLVSITYWATGDENDFLKSRNVSLYILGHTILKQLVHLVNVATSGGRLVTETPLRKSPPVFPPTCQTFSTTPLSLSCT